LPRKHRVPSWLDEETGVIVPCPQERYVEDWTEHPVTLDGETYLRLGAVDLDDPQAILGFVHDFGVLGGDDAYRALMSVARGRMRNIYESQLDEDADHWKKLRVLREDHARTGSGDSWPSEALQFAYAETLDEFRFAARCLRDFTAAWRMYQDGTKASDVRWQYATEIDPELASEDSFPFLLLEELFPQAFLRDFTPHLNFHWDPPLPAGPLSFPPREAGVSVDPRHAPVARNLYSILALELFNHIVENANYRLCDNENCRRKVFVRQQGGARKGQYRGKGVQYCSPDCAHAVAQRRYRERLKAKSSAGRQRESRSSKSWRRTSK
jgi:hypothetical protein